MQIMSGIHVVGVACGAYHTIVLTASDCVYAFGSNVAGELGLGAGMHVFGCDELM
jgi:alpha-tubulin suppressor-like RCC1 family protein